MKNRKGTVVPLLCVVVLLLAALGVYLFREQAIDIREKQQERPMPQVTENYIREVASALGLKFDPDRTDADLVTDIKLQIQESVVAPKITLSDDNISKLLKLLKPEDRVILTEGHEFLKQVTGKKVLLISGD